jgi:hypothetical protein
MRTTIFHTRKHNASFLDTLTLRFTAVSAHKGKAGIEIVRELKSPETSLKK